MDLAPWRANGLQPEVVAILRPLASQCAPATPWAPATCSGDPMGCGPSVAPHECGDPATCGGQMDRRVAVPPRTAARLDDPLSCGDHRRHQGVTTATHGGREEDRQSSRGQDPPLQPPGSPWSIAHVCTAAGEVSCAHASNHVEGPGGTAHRSVRSAQFNRQLAQGALKQRAMASGILRPSLRIPWGSLIAGDRASAEGQIRREVQALVRQSASLSCISERFFKNDSLRTDCRLDHSLLVSATHWLATGGFELTRHVSVLLGQVCPLSAVAWLV